MLTDHEKTLVRMMVLNTTPEYMAEVGAMDDETVRPLIEAFKANRLEEISRGIGIYTERRDADQAEVDRLNAIKSQLEGV